MAFLAIAILVLALATGICALLTSVRRRRTPAELRGDWWTPFEQEFRAYAQQAARRERDRKRDRGERA